MKVTITAEVIVLKDGEVSPSPLDLREVCLTLARQLQMLRLLPMPQRPDVRQWLNGVVVEADA